MRQRAPRQPKPATFPAERMIFAAWLQQLLRTSKLTGAELADRAKLSKAATYFYLDGSRIPGPDAVQKICAALHIDPATVPAFERRLVGRPAYRHVEAEADVR